MRSATSPPPARCPVTPRLAAVLAGALFALGGCEAAPPDGARNVVMVCVDALRADHLGLYGYQRPTSPRIDAFARTASVYTRAMASSAWTLPTHASLFTGLDPSAHGAYGFASDMPLLRNAHPLDGDFLTLAEALAGAGFATAAFVGNEAFLARAVQLDQGFEVYRVRHEPAVVKNQRIFRWLAARDGRPFFLFVNYMDTHRYYNTQPRPGLLDAPPDSDPTLLDQLIERVMGSEEPVPQDLVSRVVDQYDTGVAHVDQATGELLDRLRELGLFDETLIVITSDHGEFFGEHRIVEHSKDVYQEVLWIPLVVKEAGQRVAQRVDQPVSSSDVPGLVVAGLEPAIRQRLEPLFPRLPGSRPVVAENHYARTKDLLHPVWGPRFHRVRRAIFDWPYKYIESSDGRNELYDLEEDRGETRNLVTEKPEVAQRLARQLAEQLPRAQRAAPTAPAAPVDPEEAASLRELGYAD